MIVTRWQRRQTRSLKITKVTKAWCSGLIPVPRTPDRPAEHFIAVMFARPNFIEVAFARFKLVDGVGCSIVHSHRIYGERVGDKMSAWLNDNAPKIKRTLMEWNNIPSPASLRELPRKEGPTGNTKALPSKS